MQTSPDTKPKGGSIFAAKPAPGGSAPANPFASLSGQSSNLFAPKSTPTEQPKPAEAQPFKPLFGAAPAAPKPDEAKSQPSANNPFAPKSTPTEQPKPAEAQPFKPLFGAAPAAPKPDEAKSQPAANNPFAPKPSSDGTAASNPFANLSGQASNTTNNLFAQKPAAEQTPAKPAEAAKPFGSLFGSSSTPKSSEPASNPFAPKPAAEGSTPSNPFASLSAPKVTGTDSAAKPAEAQQFKPTFGISAKTPDAEKEPGASPAFGNMFATPKPAENAPSKPAESQPFKSLFGTPAPSAEAGKESSASPAFGNMFATPKSAAETAKPAESQPFKPMFGAPVSSKPTEADKEQPAMNNMFGAKKTSEEQTPAKAQPFGSMFGASPALTKSGEEKSAPTPSNPFAGLSGQNSFSSPFAPKTTEQTTAPVQAPSSLFGSSTTSKPEQEKPAQAEKSNTTLHNFNSPFSPKVASQPEKEGATANATPRAPSFPAPSDTSSKGANSCLPSSSSSSSLPSSVSSTPTVYPYDVSNTRTAQEADSLFPKRSNPATIEYPDDMNLKPLYTGSRVSHPAAGAAYQKLVMLTTAFQHQVALADPETDDIDETILLYVELRREIGIPIGSIDPEEESKRADINDREAVEEARAANQPLPARVPSPPTFTPPPVFPTKKDDSANGAAGASDTANKFKQSFSAPSAPSAPAAQPANPFTPAVAPVAPAAPASFAPVSVPAAPAPAFSIPKFGGGSVTSGGGTDFMAQFKAKADKTAAEEKAKRKAEDFDSDEDDEAEWEKKYAEEQREKHAKLQAAAAKRSVFVPGEGFKFVDDEVAPATTAVEPVVSVAAPTIEPAVEPTTSAPAPSAAPLFGNDAPPFAPNAWAGNSSVTNSERHYETNNPSPASASLLGARSGGLNPMFAPSTSPSTTSSVFGSSKPVPASQNIFGGLQSTKRKSVDESDNEDGGSRLKRSKASPPPSGMFGRVSNPATPAFTPFAQNSSPEITALTAPVPPETPPTENQSPEVTALTAPVPPETPPTENQSSEVTAFTAPVPPDTPPTATATENEEGEPGQIFDLTKGNGGEEEETVVFELRARSFKLDGSWTTQGTGVARLLQHPGTGRSRMVLRAEPSGNVILNTLLKKEYKYALTSTSVQFTVPDENGNYAQWAIRVKRDNLEQFYAKIEETKY
jgi:hypothetical protein